MTASGPVVLGAAPATADALLEIGAVLVVLAVLDRLARRAGLSPIPFYLLAGLALGEGGIAPLTASEEFIEVSAALGIVLLLLLLGLEYTPDELTDGLRRNRLVGVVDLVLNATPGAIAGVLLGLPPAGWLALAGITYISSSGVIAKVLADLGRTGNRETPGVLAVLVIEDLVMAVYLPVLAATLGGADGDPVIGIVVAVAVVAVALVVALRFGTSLSRLLFSRSDEAVLFGLLGGALLIAGLAERIGISAAVGAFLVGIAASGRLAVAAEPLLRPLRDLFAAAFFVFFGFQVDPATLPGALGPAAALALVTAATKVLTGWWGAARAGVGVAGRVRAGATLISRGEFSIVIAGLAVAAGLPDELGALAAAYVLVLAVAGPVAARVSEPAGTWLAARRRPARAAPPA